MVLAMVVLAMFSMRHALMMVRIMNPMSRMIFTEMLSSMVLAVLSVELKLVKKLK